MLSQPDFFLDHIIHCYGEKILYWFYLSFYRKYNISVIKMKTLNYYYITILVNVFYRKYECSVMNMKVGKCCYIIILTNVFTENINFIL